MAININYERVVRAPFKMVFDYFTGIEELPSRHPKYVKNVKVLNKDGKIIEFDQEISFFGKKVHSTNKLTLYPDQGKIELEVVGGDGIGSKTKMIFIETGVSTHIKLEGELHHGRLERLFGRSVKGTTEKILNEDVENIEGKMTVV
jgi:uncharacterized membrane protein